MDIETQQQINDLEELRSEHAKRLRMLELQSARNGRSTPPEVTLEIGEIKSKIVPIDAAIFKLTYVGTVRADVPGNEREGQRVGRAAERALERNRRGTVAALMDTELRFDVKLDAALREIRTALIIVGVLAGIGVLSSSAWWIVYLVTR